MPAGPFPTGIDLHDTAGARIDPHHPARGPLARPQSLSAERELSRGDRKRLPGPAAAGINPRHRVIASVRHPYRASRILDAHREVSYRNGLYHRIRRRVDPRHGSVQAVRHPDCATPSCDPARTAADTDRLDHRPRNGIDPRDRIRHQRSSPRPPRPQPRAVSASSPHRHPQRAGANQDRRTQPSSQRQPSPTRSTLPPQTRKWESQQPPRVHPPEHRAGSARRRTGCGAATFGAFSGGKSGTRPPMTSSNSRSGPVDVLQLIRAEVTNGNAFGQVVLDQLARRVREHDLAAVPHGRDTRRTMHIKTGVTLRPCRGLPRVQPHPNPHHAILRPFLSSQPPLRLDRGGYCIPRAPEGEEERITLRVNLMPSHRFERRPQDPLMLREHLRIAVT